MRKLVIIAPVVVLAAVAVFLFFKGRDHKSESEYITATLDKGDISIIVTATGSLEAVTTVQVGSQISGTISALYADFNDNVKKGQVLAQLDPTFLKAQVAQAQADLDKAAASTELAKKQYERAVTLFQTNMISESESDNTLTNYELAKTEQKSAQANLERVKTNLDYATILSPIDGVVISRNVDVGQTVAASLQAPTLFTIAQDLSRMQVNASIDEADIGKIKEGQDVQFTVDAYPERSFTGRVKQVRLSPEVVQNVVSYDVIIEVSNPELLLKPGMTANVTVLVAKREDVLRAPASAFRFHPARDEIAGRTGGRMRGPAGGASGGPVEAGAEGASGASPGTPSQASAGPASGGSPEASSQVSAGAGAGGMSGGSPGGRSQGSSGAGTGGMSVGAPGTPSQGPSANAAGGPAGGPSQGPSGARQGGWMPSQGSSPGEAGGESGAWRMRQGAGRVLWILDPAGKPKPVPCEAGISDGTFTEIVSGDFKEGETVIVGAKGAPAASNNQQVNPFAPRFPGGRR